MNERRDLNAKAAKGATQRSPEMKLPGTLCDTLRVLSRLNLNAYASERACIRRRIRSAKSTSIFCGSITAVTSPMPKVG